jgi:predicted NAD-dependent protein-ADP-ribosyltransferase YbiA (DUF1768 family)
MLPSFKPFTMSAAQAGHFIAGHGRKVPHQSRGMLPRFMDDPFFSLDHEAVMRFKVLWTDEECVAVRAASKRPDLVIYGITKPAQGVFDGRFYLVMVLNPATLKYEAHFCFDRQILSNFLASSNLKVLLRFSEAEKEVEEYPMHNKEVAFQACKAASTPTDEGYKAIFKVLASASPAKAKGATSWRNLKISPDWDGMSAKVMERVVFADLASPEFFKALCDLTAYVSIVGVPAEHVNAETVGIPPGQVFIHEANDDATYGWGVKEETGDAFSLPTDEYLKKSIPLLSRQTYAADGSHVFAGKDVLGKILTNAMRLVAGQEHAEFMERMRMQNAPFEIVYKVSASKADALKVADEVTRAADEEAAKEAADKAVEAAAKAAADDAARAEAAAEMEVSPKRPCAGLERSLSYVA